MAQTNKTWKKRRLAWKKEEANKEEEAKKKEEAKKLKKVRKDNAGPLNCRMMAAAAITALEERNGSSLVNIKKYIAANYKVNVGKLTPFIRKALKNGIKSKTFIQVKASYKLAYEGEESKGQKS